MPLTGTDAVLGAALFAAREAVLDSFRSAHPNGLPPATLADALALRQSLALADAQAIIAHLLASGTLAVVGVVTTGAGTGGVVTGNLV